jgi:hypothetical protein
MRLRLVLLAASMAAVLILAAPRAHAQFMGGGYVGFGTPGVMGFGGPVVAPGPFVGAPMVRYARPYPMMVGGPMYGPRVFYRPGWGYGPRPYGGRAFRYGYGRRWR